MLDEFLNKTTMFLKSLEDLKVTYMYGQWRSKLDHFVIFIQINRNRLFKFVNY